MGWAFKYVKTIKNNKIIAINNSLYDITELFKIFKFNLVIL